MRIVILGCGRVGARLAQLLESDGHEISIIDSDPEAFDRLPETFHGQTTLGTGIDADVLKAAGIAGAGAFAAVTNFDNTNIMACQVAKEIFGVNNVLARIYDPGRGSLYNELGLETICPTTLISTTARDILVGKMDNPPASVTGEMDAPDLARVAADANEARRAITNGAAMGGGHVHINRETGQPIVQSAPENRPAVPQAQANAPAVEQDPKTAANGRRIRSLFRH
jgi:trk system potassium uptake protein